MVDKSILLFYFIGTLNIKLLTSADINSLSGAFYNDVKLVAQIFAEEFHDYGGDMQFVYPKFRKGDANCDTFKNAFDEAFKRLLNKLM